MQVPNIFGDARLATWPAAKLAKELDENFAFLEYRGLPNLVEDYGADPTGATDSAPAFARAWADNRGGSVIVPNPNNYGITDGSYLWNSAQIQDVCCNFIGVGYNERNNSPSDPKVGSWVRITNSAIYPLTYHLSDAAGSTGFYNMAFEQAHPAPGVGWAPTNYKPIFTISSVGGQVGFNKNYVYGINKFCEAPGDHGVNGRIKLGTIFGQPFASLFSGSCLLDANYASALHMWPFWSNNVNVLAWQRANGIPLDLYRCDGFLGTSLFANNYLTPIRLSYDSVNIFTGPSTNTNFSIIYADLCKYGYWVTGNNTSLFVNTLTSAGVGVTDSSGWRDDSQGSFASIRVHNFQGAEKHIGEQNSTTNGTTNHTLSLFAQEYNSANGGHTAYYQAATSGGKNVIHLATTPSIGVVTHPAAIINDTTGSGFSSNLFSIAGLYQTNLNTVAALPTVANAGLMAKSFVTDGNVAVFGNIVAGAGALTLPVFTDIANWRMG